MASMIAVNHGTGLDTLRALTCSPFSSGRCHLVAGMGVILHRRMVGMDAVGPGCMIDELWRSPFSRPRVLGMRLW
jgi:hypothetical protein